MCLRCIRQDQDRLLQRRQPQRTYPTTQFDFLGYTFRPRTVKNRKRNSMFVSFTPAVSNKAVKAMRETTRKLNFRNRTDLSLADIARLHNPFLRGWLAYYGQFCRSAMYPVFGISTRRWWLGR